MTRSGQLRLLLLLLLWVHGGDEASTQSRSLKTLDTTGSLSLRPPSPSTPPPPPPSLPVSWISSPSSIFQHYADSSLRPFYHGLASGDPLSDQVIIWTRVTPEVHKPIDVQWMVALDSSMKCVVECGEYRTDATRDYTVKVDVQGLNPGSIYYYRFRALGKNSPIGRTRTAPEGTTDHLRFAVASCANYQHGYFNAYGRIADRDDLNAVLFLGDYLYEDGVRTDDYGPIPRREHHPSQELHSLDEYRKRHAFYKLDPALRRVHERHPFIAIWDDHEMIDDCYTKGAHLHSDRKDGTWEDRKRSAVQAYFEWMPVREPRGKEHYRIFRSFRYGDLAEIIMLDTRHEGREEQLESSNDQHLFDSQRSMLGEEQLHWFLTKLAESDAQWKLVGNQVVMSQIRGARNLDAWDGYPAERDKVLSLIEKNGIKNVLFLTGDVHISIASNIARNPFDRTKYDPTTGFGSIAVELTTPSISSANMNELLKLPPRNYKTIIAEQGLYMLNGHVKMAELDNHGYFLLDLTSERAQADWYFVKTVQSRESGERWWSSWRVRDGCARLEKRDVPSVTRKN